MKKNVDNKGIAMVTVLIAIAFMAVLSTSLAYMAYMNYLTKVLRHSATDNFYSDEFALDELSSSLQEIAADSNPASVEQAKKDLRDKTTFGGAGTDLEYDPAKLKDLIIAAGYDRNASVVNIDVTALNPGTKNYSEEANAVTYKGVVIKATDVNGYESTITTDIKIKFQAKPKGRYDVNDFSVISDSFVSGDGKAGGVVFSGCTYTRDSKGLGYAFLLDYGGRNVSFLGDFNIIDGNFVLNDNTAAYVSGEMIIDGDIKIGKNSMLVVGGSVTYSGNLDNKGTIRGKVEQDKSIDFRAKGSNSLALDVFAKHLFYWGTDGKFHDMGASYDYAIEDIKYQMAGADGETFETVIPTNFAKSIGYEKGLRSALSGKDTSNGEIASSALLLYYGRGSDGFFNIKYAAADCTVLSLVKVYMPENQTGPMSHLSDDAYFATKCNLLTINKRFNDAACDMKCNSTAPTDVNKDGTVDFLDVVEMAYKICNGGAGYTGWSVYSYKASSGEKPTKVTTMSQTTKQQISIDDDIRYILVNIGSGECIIPYGYFISPDASSSIENYVSSSNSNQNPKKTTVAYTNWSKD